LIAYLVGVPAILKGYHLFELPGIRVLDPGLNLGHEKNVQILDG
jgi:hypothetical protein